MRPDREDLTPQTGAVWACHADLRDALNDVIGEARVAKPNRLQPHTTPDLGPFYAAVNATRRAEEALDLALLDLATAAGADA
jgi:hypothetical protein